MLAVAERLRMQYGLTLLNYDLALGKYNSLINEKSVKLVAVITAKWKVNDSLGLQILTRLAVLNFHEIVIDITNMTATEIFNASDPYINKGTNLQQKDIVHLGSEVLLQAELIEDPVDVYNVLYQHAIEKYEAILEDTLFLMFAGYFDNLRSIMKEKAKSDRQKNSDIVQFKDVCRYIEMINAFDQSWFNQETDTRANPQNLPDNEKGTIDPEDMYVVPFIRQRK